MILTTQNLDLLDKNLYIKLTFFLKFRERYFEKVSACETNNDAFSISHKASIFHYSENCGILALEIKFTIELSMGDLPCLFETVRTLKLSTTGLRISNEVARCRVLRYV